ncbi:MAG: hypothetical protein ABR976_07465 [Terracidiphilus sp.]|jgi:hypothetical protein
MDNPNTCFDYYSRFFKKFFEDFVQWPWDNIFVAGVAALAPAIVLYLQHPDRLPDREPLKITLWVYLALFGLYILFHIIRVPWKIDKERSEALSKMETENAELLLQRKEFEEAKPNIVLREPGARHIEAISVNDGKVVIFTAHFVKVRFVNRPTRHAPTAIAQGVSAKIKFFDRGGLLVLEMDGRWDNTDQPTLRHITQSKRDLLLTDFAIEEEHNLDVAFLDPRSGELVALNNDNYNYQYFRKPEHILMGNQFRAEMRIVGVHVDVTYSVEFAAVGRGGNIIILSDDS